MDDSLSTQMIADRYLIQGKRGANGPVDVYDALDQQLDRPVTLQLVSSKGAENATFVRRFLRRQQIACSIHNCAVLAVYDAGTWQSRPFSVMARDAGSAPDSKYRAGYPPDLPLVLRVAREAGEALRCCRDAGLSDWTFTPETVRIDRESHATLALLEGLPKRAGSSRSVTDASAMGSLLRLMLAGRTDANQSALRAALVPDHLIDLLDRLDAGKDSDLMTAQDAAVAIAAIESASLQPTEAYDPEMLAASNGAQAASASPPAKLANTANLSEAPTLAIGQPILEASPFAGVEKNIAMHMPANEVARVDARPRSKGALFMVAAALLALALLVVVVPRFAGAARQSAENDTSNPQLVAAPDLLGKTIEEARSSVGEVDLNLVQGESVYDSVTPRDAITSQEPAPAAQVRAGGLITVSLSLGPQPKATLTPAPAQPPKPAVEPPGKGKKKGRDK